MNNKIDYFIRDNGYTNKSKLIENETLRLINNWSSLSVIDSCRFIESQTALYEFIKI